MAIKRSILHRVKTIIIVPALLSFLSIGLVRAQDPGDEDLGDPDTGIPVDGGISILLAAGAVAGARKLYLLKKQKD